MHQAYVDCLISLTKNFCESEDPEMMKYITFTYKELLKKFLGGRGAPLHALNNQFFSSIFEECPRLAQDLLKPLLNYLLPTAQTPKIDPEAAEEKKEESKEEKTEGSRTNNQRLQAIEIFNSLVKASQNGEELRAVMEENLEKICAVLITVLKNSEAWKQKKVKKTMLVLNIFTKLAKILKQKDSKHIAKIEK